MYRGLKAFISVLYSKKMKALESLIGMIQKFPYDDPTYDKLHEDLDKIRGKFKQVCPLPLSLIGEPFSEPATHSPRHSRRLWSQGCVCPARGPRKHVIFVFLFKKTEAGLENGQSLELL